MPIPFLESMIEQGPPEWMPDTWILVTAALVGTVLYLVKIYIGGATNHSERDMHGRVIMMTGATSGIGATTAYELAARGAQLILLTRLPPSDTYLADFIGEMRQRTNNQMIYAEQVDLSSLYSIRKFATKWVDNSPPRRLDMIILCAATLTPPGKSRTETEEGIEETWMVNFLANFHLLGILSPALRAQQFDRDVRVIIPTCSAYIRSPTLTEDFEKQWTPTSAYARSKLALTVFGQAYQKHLDAYKRPDQMPMNAGVVFVDPGLTRTPGMRRWLTRGTLSGLFIYLVAYILPWFFLKSPDQGAQSMLYAVMETSLGRGPGGRLIKECMEVDFARDVKNDEVAKKLWESSDKLIERTEKEQVKVRAMKKKHENEEKQDKENEEKAKEIEALVDQIKKGRAAAKAKAKKMGHKVTE